MTSCVPLTQEAVSLTRLMIAYNNIEQVLAVSQLTGPELLDFAGNCLTRTRRLPSLATLDSLGADFPESVSAVGSREDSTVPGFTLSSRTCLRRRRGGRRKIREAVINHTEATATTKTETAAAGDKKTGAVTMIIIYHSKSQSSGKANSDS